jgi:hypothetical protein
VRRGKVNAIHREVLREKLSIYVCIVIDSDIANDPISVANTAIPAEFAELFGHGKRSLAT